MIKSYNNKIVPFLRWPGGKRWLADKIHNLINSVDYSRYIEPFIGGGAVFFRHLPKNAIISDTNKDLIIAYKVIQQNPDKLLNVLRRMPTDKTTFYKTRQKILTNEIQLAARFLYLNRLAFGGMYRVNKQGKFNVPYGGDRRVDILWTNKLITNASVALKKTKIYCRDFEKILSKCGSGDVSYCDPAYTVSHNNNGFLRYNEKIFSWHDQERLANSCFEAAKRGAYVIISNAACKSIKKLYQPINPIVVERYTGVSRQIKGRGTVKEFVFVIGGK